MIDPGHPFSVPYRELVARLEERIKKGVEQPAIVRFVYQNEVTTYELPKMAVEINRVTGFITDGGQVIEFNQGAHFRFSNNRIIWLADAEVLPKDGSRFTVDYTYRERPPGLNDFNPGSVVGTLLRAFAHETKLLYEQMDQAYRRAFIDHASDVALDNVVSLLGVSRNPAVKASGYVTFSKKTPAASDVPVPLGTRVADENGCTYLTTEAAVIAAGTSSVNVTIEASDAGPDWNVGSDEIIFMPTPPAGVDSVNNDVPVTGGLNPEPDDLLQERVKHQLERAGNGTLNAIKYAVLDVDGVQGVEIVDYSVDDSIPLGEVRVRYSGGDPHEVLSVVDGTRAAGILARLETINTMLIKGDFYVIPDRTIPTSAKQNFKTAIIESIQAMGIGDALSVRRLNALVFNISGFADVAEAQLTFEKEDVSNPGNFLTGEVTDPFLIASTELVRPAEEELAIMILLSITTTSIGISDDHHDLEIQILDELGTAVEFTQFSLDVNVILRAFLRNAPEQPAERIDSFTHPLVFTATTTTMLPIPLDASGYPAGFRPPGETDPHDPERGVEVYISAAAYPGLQGTVAIMTLAV